MKKLLVGLCAVFISNWAIANSINWHAGNQIIQTTTCESGENVIVPTAPAKYGYIFKEWKVSKNLFDINSLSDVSGYAIIDGDTFAAYGYPAGWIPLKKLAPGLEDGDTIKITREYSDGTDLMNIRGVGVLSFNTKLTLTEDLLNSSIAFYGKPGGVEAVTITGMQIIKIETPSE